MKALADDAAEQGVALALLPMSPVVSSGWSFLSSLDETLDVIDRSGRGARIAFDVYHLWQEPRLVDRIPELAPYVAVVQLSDWRGIPRSEYDRCRPGDGRIPLTAIVHAFDEAGYGGYYELAIWSEELWKSDYTRDAARVPGAVRHPLSPSGSAADRPAVGTAQSATLRR